MLMKEIEKKVLSAFQYGVLDKIAFPQKIEIVKKNNEEQQS